MATFTPLHADQQALLTELVMAGVVVKMELRADDEGDEHVVYAVEGFGKSGEAVLYPNVNYKSQSYDYDESALFNAYCRYSERTLVSGMADLTMLNADWVARSMARGMGGPSQSWAKLHAEYGCGLELF